MPSCGLYKPACEQSVQRSWGARPADFIFRSSQVYQGAERENETFLDVKGAWKSSRLLRDWL